MPALPLNIIHRIYCNNPAASHLHTLLERKISQHAGYYTVINVKFHAEFFFKKKSILYMCIFCCIYVCSLHACQVSMENSRGHWLFWNWSLSGQLWVTMWVLGSEPGSFGRIVNVTTTEPSFQSLCFFLLFKNMLLLFLCIYGYTWECMCMPHVCGYPWRLETLKLWVLELQEIVSPSM